MKAPPKKERNSRKTVEAAKPQRVYNTAPVIVKCTGAGCAKRDTCTRFTSVPAETNQPWFCEIVSIPDKNKCSFFMDNSDGQ